MPSDAGTVMTDHELFRLIGWLRSYWHWPRSWNANSIRTGRVLVLILFHDVTDTLAFGSSRLSVSRAGM